MRRWLPIDDRPPLAPEEAAEAAAARPAAELPSLVAGIGSCTRCKALTLLADAQAHGEWHRRASVSRPGYSLSVEDEAGVRCQACIAVEMLDGQRVIVLCAEHTPPTPEVVADPPPEVIDDTGPTLPSPIRRTG